MKKIIWTIIIVTVFLCIIVLLYKNVYDKKTITDGTFVDISVGEGN